MNRKKIEIIKKILGTDEWYLKEDRNRFGEHIFIFNKDGEVIIQYNTEYRRLFLKHGFFFKVKDIFGFNEEYAKRFVGIPIEKLFNWNVKIILKGFMFSSDEVEEYFKTK